MNQSMPETLVVARHAAGITQQDLWMRYFALGGMSQPLELEAIVHNALHTTAHDRDLLVHALNERFSELGRDHPIPYSDEPDSPPEWPIPFGDRDRAADMRDQVALAHGEQAVVRDRRAADRDDQAMDRHDPWPHREAASDRAAAEQDRHHSAADRRHASQDRDAAAEDRVHSARERHELLLDGLTQVYRRESGLLELEREVTKAHRTGMPFVLAFLDVDGLKTVNDSRGHGAGDQLLRQVVDTIRGVVREYDLIVRYGGDEFVCGLGDLRLPAAARRFKVANASLAITCKASISVGLAELQPHESLSHLIARADSMMYEKRAQHEE